MKEISVKNYKGKNKLNIPIKNNFKQKSNSIKNNVIINKNKSEISSKNIFSKLINPSFSPLKNELIKNKFNPNPNSFENFLIERQTTNDELTKIFDNMISKIKQISRTLKESQHVNNCHYQPENTLKQHKNIINPKVKNFDLTLLSIKEKNDLYANIILDSNKRINIYEEHINIITNSLLTIRKFLQYNEDEVNPSMMRLNRTLDSFNLTLKESLFIKSNLHDTENFLIDRKRKYSNTQTFSKILDSEYQTIMTNDTEDNYNSSIVNKFNHKNNFISQMTTISKNNSLLSIKQNNNNISSIFSSSYINKNYSNHSINQISSNNDLKFTIENSTQKINNNNIITSRYEASEIEEYSRIQYLNNSNYKKNNLKEKNYTSQFKREHSNTNSFKVCNDSNFDKFMLSNEPKKPWMKVSTQSLPNNSNFELNDEENEIIM